LDHSAHVPQKGVDTGRAGELGNEAMAGCVSCLAGFSLWTEGAFSPVGEREKRSGLVVHLLWLRLRIGLGLGLGPPYLRRSTHRASG
jgi:hypothetical protein